MVKHRPTHPVAGSTASEDASAFRTAMRGVKPLAHAVSVTQAAEPKPRKRVRKSPAAEPIELAMPLIGAPGRTDARPLEGGDVQSYQRPGVRTQVVRRLRRGLIGIEGELDLHGLGQAAARDQLAEFLAFSRASGRRCVRIIHGKGYRSGARGPILKMAVDTWLRRQPDVMAFTSARPIDGGTGAVYVLLRA